MKTIVLMTSLLALLFVGCDSDPLGVSVQNDTSNVVKVSVDDDRYTLEVAPNSTRRILLKVNYDPERIVVEEHSDPPRRFTVRFDHEISGFGDAYIVIE